MVPWVWGDGNVCVQLCAAVSVGSSLVQSNYSQALLLYDFWQAWVTPHMVSPSWTRMCQQIQTDDTFCVSLSTLVQAALCA
jgi:hypothetical protein